MAKTLTPADLEPLVASPEFQALKPDERGTVLNGALREAHQYVTDNVGWTPERFKDFGDVASGLRDTALSKSVGEHVAGAVRTIGGVIKDSAGSAVAMATAATMPGGGSVVTDALGANLHKLGKSVQGTFSTADEPLNNELNVLKQDLDKGNVPSDPQGWSDWLDQRHDRIKQTQVHAYTKLDGNTPESRAFAEANSLLGNPQNAALVADYLRTRDPAVWDQLRQSLQTGPTRAALNKEQERIANKTVPGALLNATFGKGSGQYLNEATDPMEVAGMILPMLKGAKALKAVKEGSKLKAAGELVAGAAGEAASEVGSLYMDDPGASWNQRLQVVKDAFIGSLGLAGVGAGVSAIANRNAAVPPPLPSSSENPASSNQPNDNLPPNQTTPASQPPAAAGAAAQMGATAPETAAPAIASAAAGSPLTRDPAEVNTEFQQSALNGIAQRAGAVDPLLPEHVSDLSAEDIQDLETGLRSREAKQGDGVMRQPILQNVPDGQNILPATANPNEAQTITGSNVQMGTEMPVPPPTADAGAGAGAAVSPRTPEQIAESTAAETARQSQIAQLRARESQVGRGPVIPDSPLGVYDILDFVNENKIRVPRSDSTERKAGEYDWTETYSVPQYYRKFLGSSDRGGSIDQVSQAAFENGFIREPTADALMGAIQQTIDTRKQYKVQFAKQAKEQAVVEKQTLDFEKTQQTLRRKDKERVFFEDITPGDEMTIDGEQAVVKNIEYTEDGYLTNVVIEDGKRFGLMNFDPQTRSGLFVDEFTPRPEAPTGFTNTSLKRDLEAGFMTTTGADALLDLAHRAFAAGQTFVQWSKTMLQRFGEAVRAWLAGVWDHAKRSSQTGAVNFTGRLGTDLQKAAQQAKGKPQQTSANNGQQLQTAYFAAMQGRSTAMVPIKDVYEQAKAQNPLLTPQQFMAEVQAGDNAGTVLLEPPENASTVAAAGPFTLRNASGIVTTSMMVQRGFTHLDVSGQRSQAGFVMGPGRPDKTRSRMARPDEDEHWYETRADGQVKFEADNWLNARTLAEAVDQLTGADLPAGITSEDVRQQVFGLAIRRAMQLLDQGDDFARSTARVLANKLARLYQDAGRESARAMRQRAVVNHELQPYAPILAAEGLLIDRADAVMDKRFVGGAVGGAAKLKKVADDSSAEAGDNLAAQLDTELEEAPELGNNTDLQTGPDPRIADLEARLKELRTQMAAGDAAMQETTSTWQKILELLNAASQRKSAMLNGARSSLALARKAAQNRKAQRRAEGRLNANPVEDFADDAIIGTAFLAEGIVEFFNWGQAMIREIGARSNTELKQLYAAASKNYLAALKAEQAKPQKPTGKRTPAREKINKAQRTAQSILDELSRRYSDPPIFAEGQRKVNAMRELYKEHVKNPMPEAAFVSRAQALGANGGTAGTLWEAANLEIEAREIMTREAMRAKAQPLLVPDSPQLARMLNDLRKKMFPGMNWQAIFEQLPSQQRERQRELYTRLRKDQRLRNLNQTELLQLTNELDKAWQRERRKVFMRELSKAGALGEKDASDRQKAQKAMPKLLRAINLGLMTSETFREAVAPEYGLRMLTSAEAAQLRSMAEKAYEQPVGVLRNKLLAEMLANIQTKVKGTWIEILNSYWTAAVLSGLRTQFDTFMAAANGLGTNLIQAGTLAARGKFTASKEVHAEWWRGFGEGARESLRILTKGDYSLTKRFNLDLQKALEGDEHYRPVPLGETMFQERTWGMWQKYPAAIMMFVGRAMAAADHINNTATTRGAMAVARALNPELYAHKAGFTVTEREAAFQQALNEVSGGSKINLTKDQQATLSARTREILYSGVKPAEAAAASEVGDMAAYQNDPTGVFGWLYDVLKSGLGRGAAKLGEVSENVDNTKATRVMAALVGGAMYGITGTRFMRFGFNFGADITRYVPGTYLADRLGFYGQETSQQQRDLLLGKNVVGLLIASSIAAMFLGKDDEDEGWHIEGPWNSLSLTDKNARRSAGIEPLSMWKRVNGKITRVYYKQWPTMGIFAAVGGMADEKRFEPGKFEQRGVTGHLLHAAATGLTQIQNVSAMRNLGELFAGSYTQNAEDVLVDKMSKTATNYLSGFTPRVIKDVEAWFNPQNYKPEGIMEQLIADQPVLRSLVNNGRPQLSVLGKPVELNRAPWSRVTTSQNIGPEEHYLAQLMVRGINLPGASDKKMVTRDGTKQTLESLGGDVSWRYQKAVGEGYAELLRTNGQQLLTLPADQAQKWINTSADRIKSIAMMKVMQP